MDKLLSVKELRQFLGVSDRELRRLIAEKRLRPARRHGGRAYFRAEDAIVVGARKASPAARVDRRDVLAFAHAVLRLQVGAAGMAQKHKEYRPQYAQLFDEWRVAAESSEGQRSLFFERWDKNLTGIPRKEDVDFAAECDAKLSASEIRVLTAWYAAAACPWLQSAPIAKAARREFEFDLQFAELPPLLVTGWKRYADDFEGWRSARGDKWGLDIPRDLRDDVKREAARRAAAFRLPPFREDVAHYAGLSRMQTYRILKRIKAKLSAPRKPQKGPPGAAAATKRPSSLVCPECGVAVAEDLDTCPECGRLL